MSEDFEILETTLPTEPVATEAVTMVVMDAQYYQLVEQSAYNIYHCILWGAMLICGVLAGLHLIGGFHD